MKKLLFIIIFFVSFTCSAENWTQNRYQKVVAGKDYVGHEYIILESDMNIVIYSMEQLFTQHNKVSSILLIPEDFNKLINEYKPN